MHFLSNLTDYYVFISVTYV